jgi:hypothetical protein
MSKDKESKSIKFIMIQSNGETCSWIKGLFKEEDIGNALDEISDEMLEQYEMGIKSVLYFEDCSLWSM